MDQLNLNALDATLKEDYLPSMRSTINMRRYCLEHFERDAGKTDASGRRAVFPVNIRGSQAIGSRMEHSAEYSSAPEYITLPQPQKQTYIEIRVPYTSHWGSIRVTHPALIAAARDVGAFVRALGGEMEGIARDLKNDQNRMMFGFGNGVLGAANGAGAATTALVMMPGHRIKAGMVIDMYTAYAAGTQKLNSIAVSSVSGNAVTLATASTWSTGNYAYREDSRGYEMMGLMGIVDDASKTSGIGAFVTTLFNVSRSSYPEWNAIINEHPTNPGTARALDADLLDTAILNLRSEREGNPDIMITSPTQWRKIGSELARDRRFAETQTLHGGYEAWDWSGIPCIWDPDCRVDWEGSNDMLYILEMDTFTFLELADWNWMDEDGNVLSRVSGSATAPGLAAFDGSMYKYNQLMCHDPGRNSVIRDLQTT